MEIFTVSGTYGAIAAVPARLAPVGQLEIAHAYPVK